MLTQIAALFRRGIDMNQNSPIEFVSYQENCVSYSGSECEPLMQPSLKVDASPPRGKGAIAVCLPETGVAVLSMRSGRAKVLTRKVRTELSELLELVRDCARCVVVAGHDAFCGGADLRELRAVGSDTGEVVAEYERMFLEIEAFPVPVIAAIGGHCHGGGIELALACDSRIASTTATFVASGVNVGLLAGSWRLPRTIGVGRAKQLLFTGEGIDAQRALDWGLVTVLSASADLQSVAVDCACRVASRAPLSVAASQRCTGEPFGASSVLACAQLDELTRLLSTEDHAATVDALFARHAPSFAGR